MIWNPDPHTLHAAIALPIRLPNGRPTEQFAGYRFNPQWNDRTMRGHWLVERPRSSPDQIISHFRAARYLEGVIMVTSWGRMMRGHSRRMIYGENNRSRLRAIERAIEFCVVSISSERSIRLAWGRLVGEWTGELGWTPVMASKTLHFLCRAIFAECRMPPVPLDSTMRELGQSWRNGLPNGHRPGGWNDNSFAAYNRYMTAIITWAQRKGWTTTEMETTLFNRQR